MILIDGFAIDAALTENHAKTSDTTEYPVEKGADITDHIRPKPREVEINGIVSDSPMGAVAIARVHKAPFVSDDVAPDTLPTVDVLAKLQEIYDTQKIVSIQTTLQVYDNMCMYDCQIPRSKDDGESIQFTCSFREIIFITNDLTTVRVAIPAAAAQVDQGTKAATPANPNLVNRMVDPSDGAWFDPDINGWRYGASFNGTNWEFYKGDPTVQPKGMTDAQLLEANQQGLTPIDTKPNGDVTALPAQDDTTRFTQSGTATFNELDAATAAQNAGQQVQLPNTFAGPGLDLTQPPP
jgi:hypothetical protein